MDKQTLATMQFLRKITILAILIIYITQNFNCTSPDQGICSDRVRDTTLLPLNILNISNSMKVYDTIWFESTISDTFNNRQSSDKLIADIGLLTLRVQPYRVIQTDTIPSIIYSNLEFNPVLQEGTITTDYYSAYNFIFKRKQPNNHLKAGFVLGKPGLYVFVFIHSLQIGNDLVNVSDVNNYCKQFHGVTAIKTDQQNKEYWDTLKVSALNIQNSEYMIIQKRYTNYFFIRVTN